MGVVVGARARVRVGVRVAVSVAPDVAVGSGVAVGNGVLPCRRQPKTMKAKASENITILQIDVLQLIPLLCQHW